MTGAHLPVQSEGENRGGVSIFIWAFIADPTVGALALGFGSHAAFTAHTRNAGDLAARQKKN